MRNNQRGIILAAALVALLALSAVLYLKREPPQPKEKDFVDSGVMRIQSTDFEPNGPIPARFTCDGENISPKLSVSGVPEDAVSLVLVVDDPDAPMGTWVHWLVWNIPPQTVEIASAAVPAGSVEGVTSFGRSGYGGPCPPSGTHRYFFKLYALDQNLSLTAAAKVQELDAAMSGHVLDKAGLVGVYGR